MKYNILYKGERLHSDLSLDECLDIMTDMSLDFYKDGTYDPNEVKLEVIKNGNESW